MQTRAEKREHQNTERPENTPPHGSPELVNPESLYHSSTIERTRQHWLEETAPPSGALRRTSNSVRIPPGSAPPDSANWYRRWAPWSGRPSRNSASSCLRPRPVCSAPAGPSIDRTPPTEDGLPRSWPALRPWKHLLRLEQWPAGFQELPSRAG